YANQYNREDLSRNEAENLFKEIIDKSSEWSEATSLTNLTHVTNNEESELEERFISLLKDEFKGKALTDFQEITEHGLRTYLLRIKEIDSSITYEIRPQNFGYPLVGVRYTTRPDFVFKCVSLTLNGEEKSMEEVQQVKDIIVYLDGYQFHATSGNLRVFSDLKIRDAISQSNRYNMWIFSWEDIIEHAGNKSEDSFYKKLSFDEIAKISPKHPLLKSFDLSSIKKANSFVR